MLLSCSFFFWVLCLATLHYSPPPSEGDVVKQDSTCRWETKEPALPGCLSHPLLVTAFSVGICWPSGDFQGVCLISGLQAFQAQYAAGHPIRAQGLRHVDELVGAPLQSWNLGDKTLDKARKKRIGIEFILVQDRQFLKLRSGDK